MILDAHTHIEGLPGCTWKDPPEDILRLMDEADIARAVVMTYVDAPGDFGAYDPVGYVAEAVAKWPDRLIGFARMDPTKGEAAVRAFTKAVREYGFRGLKLHPFGYRAPPDGAETVALLEAAAALKVPALFHCGDEDYTTPLQLGRAAAKVPAATVIFGHMGGYFHVREAIRVAKAHPNVVLETSASPYPDLIRLAVRELGPERVLFASDGPGCDPKLEVKKVLLADLERPELELVLGRNLERLVGKAP